MDGRDKPGHDGFGGPVMRIILVIFAVVASIAAATAQNLPSGFAYLRDVDPTIIQDIRYATANNFVGHPLTGYGAAECVVKREVGLRLKAIQQELAKDKLSLKMFDCYRPQRAVMDMVRWSRNGNETAAERRYNPAFRKADLFRLGYISNRSGHSRGSTVDLTIVRRVLGHAPLAPGDREMNMGTRVDFFGPHSGLWSRAVSAEAQANRKLLATAMSRRGFRPYDKEWWHFTLRGEPFPHAYFDFPVR